MGAECQAVFELVVCLGLGCEGWPAGRLVPRVSQWDRMRPEPGQKEGAEAGPPSEASSLWAQRTAWWGQDSRTLCSVTAWRLEGASWHRTLPIGMTQASWLPGDHVPRPLLGA